MAHEYRKGQCDWCGADGNTYTVITKRCYKVVNACPLHKADALAGKSPYFDGDVDATPELVGHELDGE